LSLIVGKNVKNTPPTVAKDLVNFLVTWEKLTSSQQIYARGARLTSSFLDRWEGEKINNRVGFIDVRFQEVEGDKHNFVSLPGFLI
jgi:hypothetical protein